MSEIPQAVDAEEHVLGSVLMSASAGDRVSAALKPEMFFRESNGVLFETLVEMLNAGIPTEPVTVEAYLGERGLLETTGGKVRLYELLELTPATANVLHYARIVKDAWKKRLVLRAVTEIGSKLETMSADEAVSALDEATLNIEQMVDEKHELVVDIKDLIASKRYDMEHPEAKKTGVPTPFTFLPDLMGGRLYILSGYMKDGKSRAALQFAAAAAEAGEKVGFASAEMSKQDLFDAWACQRTGLPYYKVSQPWTLDPREQRTLEEKMTEMESWRVQVIDDETIDPGKLRRYQRAGKYDLLIIDHLHRMSWRDRHHVEQGVKSITNIAREFEIPVVLLAQLSRAGDYSKPFPVPTMRQLRETAMIEGEASAVWFVYRERDENHVQTNTSQFIVAANRYGKAGTEVLYFDDASQSFMERGWTPVESSEEEVKSGELVGF
jgi:replicative DNA helicase